MTAPLTLEKNSYLTVGEVAARFSVSVATIHRWCKNGHFPAPITFGMRISRWSLIDLINYEIQQAANLSAPPQGQV